MAESGCKGSKNLEMHEIKIGCCNTSAIAEVSFSMFTKG